MIETFELFNNMAKDQSFHPSTFSIRAPEARALFGSGQAGFLVQGVWCIGVWGKENPDLNLGVMPPPVSSSGRIGSVAFSSANPWLGISAKSKHPEAAAQFLKALYSTEYDYQKDNVSNGVFFSSVEGINEAYINNSVLQEYYAAANEVMRVAPNPKSRHPETVAFYQEYKDVSPGIGDLLQGVVAGAITDIPKSLTDYSRKVSAAFEKAVEQANKKDSNVTAEDFRFDWDPMTNYK